MIVLVCIVLNMKLNVRISDSENSILKLCECRLVWM